MRGAYSKILVFAMMTMVLVQCGILEKGGINSKISFKANPRTPVVINSDFTLITGLGDDGILGTSDDETKKIAAPWFMGGFDVVNASEHTITVQNISYTATGFDVAGRLVDFKGALDPEELDQSYLMELTAGAQGSTTGWYFYGLPPDVVGYNYSFTATIEGWQGARTAPEKRIDKQTTFSTR